MSARVLTRIQVRECACVFQKDVHVGDRLVAHADHSHTLCRVRDTLPLCSVVLVL